MGAISINNVSKSYGGKAGMPAVSNLNIQVPGNCFLTLLGPSGCGKTTTLRLIAGYLEPDSGDIRIGGRIVSAKGNVVPPERRGMGMVFQNYAIWPHKTVFENVAFGLKLRKVSGEDLTKRVMDALHLVNLDGLDKRYPNELSGGQQQRVALARSLVVEPEILLLDEPLSNLDAKLRERMRSELKQLQRRTGITFVYVTHDQAEALALSDQIAVIHDGRLQQLGSPLELYTQPANRFVADFMGSVNTMHGTLVPEAGGTATFECADFTLPGVVMPQGMPGRQAELIVRPENVRFAMPGDPSLFQARVLERTFLGNLCEYQIALASGAKMNVQTHPLQLLETGSTAGININAATCSVFATAPNAASSSSPGLAELAN